MSKRSFYRVAMMLIVGALSSYGQSIFEEDFQKKSPVEFWTSNGKYKINFMGLTTENAPKGRKVFKLDVSFLKQAWGYYYFKIPCKFMPSGNFKLKVRTLAGKDNSGEFGFGVNVFYPELGRDGCQKLNKSITGSNGKWQTLELDAGGWLLKSKADFSKKYAPLANADNLSPYVNGIVLFLYGTGKNKRITLYLDKVEVSGQTIPEIDWKELQQKHWNPVLQKQQKLLAEYRTLVDKYIQTTGKSTFADNCQKLLEKLEKKQKQRGRRFLLNLNDYQQIMRNMADLKTAGNKKLSDNALVYTLNNPVINTMILPSGTVPEQALLGGKELKVVAAQGEFEPFSILVKAIKKLDKLTIICDNLKNSDGAIIPAANIDLKSVKCWYQSGGAWYTYAQSNSRKITPELLLNDDSLVKVDDKLKTNFIKLRFPDGSKYWNADDPKWNKKRGTVILPIDKFPIRDTKKLLPLTLNANHLKQFWGTVKAPQNACAGIYTGTLKVVNGNDILAKITLKVRVLPFTLPMPKTRYDLKHDFICSIFYRSRYSPKYPAGTISSESRSLEQIAAELKNMYEHNIYNPNCYQGFGDKASLGKMLQLRNAAGMKGLPVYYIKLITYPAWAKQPDMLTKQVIEIKNFMQKFGVPEYYCFGVDEAYGKHLQAQLEVWQLVHNAGGKIFATGGMRNLPTADKVDIEVLSHKPERSKAKLWKEKNKKVKLLAYAWPQGGIEDPVINRRDLGLVTWLANYDGIMTYAYMHSMGNGWNDFDHLKYREHNYVYPTTDGVISTLALAGFREGVDDIRYATKLKQLIEQCGKGPKAKLAAAAQAYLDKLDANDDLYLIRLEMIDYILKLLK